MGKLSIEPGSLVWAAALVLLLPLRWLMGACLAALVHELSHYGALKLLGCPVASVTLGPFGARMDTGWLPPGKELICALAGPVGGLCLILFARWLPLTACCALIHSVFNLLPIFPLDGGRAVRSLAAMLAGERWAEGISRGIGLVTAIVLGMATFAAWRFGALLLLLAVVPRFLGKRPCKTSCERVQ